MNKKVFSLSISSEQFLAYYRGHSSTVLATSADGKMIQFPAIVLRPYLDAQGVHGCFEIQFNQVNKLVRLEKISA